MVFETFDAPTLITTGIVLVIGMVLAFRLLNRDPTVKRTRWGFFVERERDPPPPGKDEEN